MQADAARHRTSPLLAAVRTSHLAPSSEACAPLDHRTCSAYCTGRRTPRSNGPHLLTMHTPRLGQVDTTLQLFTYEAAPEEPWPLVHYEITLYRASTFYLNMLIWPSIVLTLLSFGAFFMPPECGERLGYGITLILAIEVFKVVVNSMIPICGELMYAPARMPPGDAFRVTHCPRACACTRSRRTHAHAMLIPIVAACYRGRAPILLPILLYSYRGRAPILLPILLPIHLSCLLPREGSYTESVPTAPIPRTSAPGHRWADVFSAMNEIFCFAAVLETTIVLYFSLSADESKLPPWLSNLVGHYTAIVATAAAKHANQTKEAAAGAADVSVEERTYSRNFQARRSLATELTRALNNAEAQRSAREPARPLSPGGQEETLLRPIRRDATGNLYTMRPLDMDDHAKVLYYEQVSLLTTAAHALLCTCSARPRNGAPRVLAHGFSVRTS